MSGARRWIVERICRRLPPDISVAAAGDIEEEWHRRAGDSTWTRRLWLTRELAALVRCAWSCRGQQRALIDDRRGGPIPMLSNLSRDVRYAFRLSGRNPTATAISLLTLALGLGAATALFALTNAWLLRPLPFADADRLVAVWETIPSQDIFENTPAAAVLFDWRARSHAFEALGALRTGTTNMTGGGDPERVNIIRADDELVRALRVSPAVGRMFSSGDTGAEVVLSNRFWRRRFGAARDAVGWTVVLDGAPATIVGVLPAGVSLLGIDADAWLPLRFNAAQRASLNRNLWVVGRLRPGATVEQASADVDAIARAREPRLGARAVSLQEQTVGALGHDLPILLGATGVLLLIACANVASLTLARAAARRREFALRAALGASRTRLARQVIVEAMPTAILGGAAGLLVSGWLVRTFTAFLPQRETLSPVQLADPRVFAFGAGASLAAAILFALAPALQSASRRTLTTLREGARGQSASQAPFRLLASIEIALAVALLIAAALVGRSFLRLTQIDLGFRTDGVVTFELPRPVREGRPADTAFFEELLRRLAETRGIAAAGLSQALPLKSFGFGSNFPVEGAAADAPSHLAYWRIVSSQYFDALSVPLRAGRPFGTADRAGAPLVAIVSESFARSAWPAGVSPIGKRIGWATLEHPMVVVGVAADVHLSAATAAAPTVYMPFAQVEAFEPSQLAVRSLSSTVETIETVRRTVWSIDPLQPVADIQTLDALSWKLLARRRFQLALWSAFAAAAAVLALLGVYGVISYAVRRSTKELGIRLALGARPALVIAHVLRESLWITAAGAAAGVLVAYWAADAIRGFLVAIEPRDPILYAAVVFAVLAAALLAAVVPALRAARIDPLDAIRAE